MKTFQQEFTKKWAGDRKFTLYWVCDGHRVPLNVCQPQFGGNGSWEVNGGGYTIVTIYIRSESYCYHDADYDIDDIQAIVDAITDFTGEGYMPVHFYRIGLQGPIARYPPYFEPVFRDVQAEQSYFRMKLKDAQLRQKLKE